MELTKGARGNSKIYVWFLALLLIACQGIQAVNRHKFKEAAAHIAFAFAEQSEGFVGSCKDICKGCDEVCCGGGVVS